jgi:regulator of replication initiation timing
MFGLSKRMNKLIKKNDELIMENELLKNEVESYKRIWEQERKTNDELVATIAREKTIKKRLFS